MSLYLLKLFAIISAFACVVYVAYDHDLSAQLSKSIASYLGRSSSSSQHQPKRLTFEGSVPHTRTFEQKIVVSGELELSPTTVISIYFQFKSKHTTDKYDAWLNNFLTSVSGAPLVLFIDTKSYERFKHMRHRDNTSTIYIVYDNIWDLMREFENKTGRVFTDEYRRRQWNMDIEKKYHTPELYAIWNLKSFYVNKVVEQNPYQSEFFIYTDAGAWRDRAIPDWPDQTFVKEVKAKMGGKGLLFGLISMKHHEWPGWRDAVEGTFFAGTAEELTEYQKVFFQIHDKLLDAGRFIGKTLTSLFQKEKCNL